MITKVSTHLSEKLKDANSMESKGFASLKKEAEKLITEYLLPSIAPTNHQRLVLDLGVILVEKSLIKNTGKQEMQNKEHYIIKILTK